MPKTHKPEVIEIAEESKISLGGLLALVSKVTEKEGTEKESSDEKGWIVNVDDEAIAFYSNNKVKKFYKKPFGSKVRTGEAKVNFSGKVNEEKKF